ncbi:MAG: hypothetical protein QGG36_29400 [Pirellulaceae bacterium]|jgi:hypothetical protein|nr:hypothetical protein [Pirellulaceae bacterium]
MKKALVLIPVLAFALVLAVGLSAQVKKGKTRGALTKQLMGGLVRPNCAGLGAALKKEPADDKAWAALATQAALLNEASYILMADGRCPDGDWKAACDTLRGCSKAVMAKIEAKDLEGANTAFKALTGACGACHKKHKK